MNCVPLDVTHTKREQEKLRLTMERHQIIMDQTNDIIFEWDIHQNKILYSSNWAKKFASADHGRNRQTDSPGIPCFSRGYAKLPGS